MLCSANAFLTRSERATILAHTSGFHGIRRTNMRRRTLLAGLLLGVFSLPAIGAQPKGEGKIKDLTFDDIKFEMKKGDPFERSLLTKKIEDVSGTTIRIRGYMLPSFQQKGITQFVLVRDNM